jgi:hypothetical protein
VTWLLGFIDLRELLPDLHIEIARFAQIWR